MKKFNSNNFNKSIFYEYAVLMDENLKNANLIIEDYATTKIEMMARSFESFVHIKLNKKGIKNLISNINRNNFTPDEIEMKTYLSQWENVISDIRNLFNEMYPVNKIKKGVDIDKISNNINKIKIEMRGFNELNTHNIKIG